MAETVMCTSAHPEDLSDGRTLGPGDIADGVDVSDPHNADLLATDRIRAVNYGAASADEPRATERHSSRHPSTGRTEHSKED